MISEHEHDNETARKERTPPDVGAADANSAIDMPMKRTNIDARAHCGRVVHPIHSARDGRKIGEAGWGFVTEEVRGRIEGMRERHATVSITSHKTRAT